MNLQNYQHFRHKDWRCLREKKIWIFVCGKFGRTNKEETLKNSLFYRIRLM